MLATIRKILAYFDWLMMCAFFIVFGILLFEKSVIASIVTFAVVICIIYIMIQESSPTYSASNRVSGGKLLGNPLVDIALAAYAFETIDSAGDLWSLYVTGIVMVSVDLLFWIVKNLEAVLNKKQ